MFLFGGMWGGTLSLAPLLPARIQDRSVLASPGRKRWAYKVPVSKYAKYELEHQLLFPGAFTQLEGGQMSAPETNNQAQVAKFQFFKS